MIVVQNHIPVKKEYSEQFEQTLINRKSFLTRFHGFLRNDIMRPVMGDTYIILTYWNSKEEFNAWTESDEFQKSHDSSIPREAFTGKSIVTIHEVFHSVTTKHELL